MGNQTLANLQPQQAQSLQPQTDVKDQNTAIKSQSAVYYQPQPYYYNSPQREYGTYSQVNPTPKSIT
jgi:hypothetical protein